MGEWKTRTWINGVVFQTTKGPPPLTPNRDGISDAPRSVRVPPEPQDPPVLRGNGVKTSTGKPQGGGVGGSGTWGPLVSDLLPTTVHVYLTTPTPPVSYTDLPGLEI